MLDRKLLGLPLLAALAITGCGASVGGGIDTDKAESEIRTLVEKQVGSGVKSVSCPDDVEEKKGDVFTCEVVGTDGSKGDVTVTQKDDEGNVNFRAPFVQDAERLIADGVKGQSSVKEVTVTCPEIIEGKAGAKFQCGIVGDGRKAVVQATQTNGSGGFDYEVVNGAGG